MIKKFYRGLRCAYVVSSRWDGFYVNIFLGTPINFKQNHFVDRSVSG
ncbi:MAG: hypothetical protein LBT09_07885 [Planctomycetaceae bacterium]|jgi:hypothetical protein|nr:hypothetical protein [Planctomycetaceae bacterium]